MRSADSEHNLHLKRSLFSEVVRPFRAYAAVRGVDMIDLTKRKPSVVLADDHPGTLRIISQLIRDEFEILAVASNGAQAVQAVAAFHPDVVVLDVAMPGTSGFQAAGRIRELALPTRIVFLTITEDWDYALTATKLGASYVLKRRLHCDLIPAVHEALAGRLFLSPIAVANRGVVDVQQS